MVETDRSRARLNYSGKEYLLKLLGSGKMLQVPHGNSLICKADYYSTDECAKLSPASTDKKALRLFKAQRPPSEEARSGEGRPPSSLPDNGPTALPLRRGPCDKSLRIYGQNARASKRSRRGAKSESKHQARFDIRDTNAFQNPRPSFTL
jgi:hypothetical protein